MGFKYATSRNKTYQLLCVNYSGYIIGDDAIFEALLGIIKATFGSNVLLKALTAMPERTLARYSQILDAEHIYEYTKSPATERKVIQMVAKADLVIIGGGDIIEGQTALIKLVGIAWALGVPVVYVGIGVLMPHRKLQQTLLRWSMSHAYFIATRDLNSKELLQKIGVQGTNIVTLPDLANSLSIPSVPTSRQLLTKEGIDLAEPYVALNLRQPDTSQYERNWGEVEYAEIRSACQFLIDSYGYKIIGVPMTLAISQPNLDNNELSDDQLLEQFGLQLNGSEFFQVLKQDYRPPEIAAILQGAKLVIGVRLHFLMLAANRGVPPIALSYANKVRAFMQNLGLEDKYCLEMSNVSANALIRAIEQAHSESEELSHYLINQQKEASAKLNQLVDVFRSAVSKKKPFENLRYIPDQFFIKAFPYISLSYKTVKAIFRTCFIKIKELNSAVHIFRRRKG